MFYKFIYAYIFFFEIDPFKDLYIFSLKIFFVYFLTEDDER